MAKSAMQRYLDLRKRETLVLGQVERLLLKPRKSDRRDDVIHPSEMAKAGWCHRATYYRLAGYKEIRPENPSFILERIFEEGHDIHRKWQQWFWQLGLLKGIFRCLHCNRRFQAISPKYCPHTGCYSKALDYVEVPVYSDEHLIAGHSDGDLDGLDALLEVKSIGIGTLRFEAPELLIQHTHKCEAGSVLDIEGLWKNLRRPFSSHLRQGNIYLHCTGRSRMVFIYEFKANQQVKEFVVKYSPDVVEPMLDACLDIRYHLEKKKEPPPCPNGGCTDCRRYEVGDDSGEGAQDEESQPEEGQRGLRGEGREGKVVALGAPEADEGDAPRSPARAVRVVRRRPYGSDVRSHRVG